MYSFFHSAAIPHHGHPVRMLLRAAFLLRLAR
jgi:hypothetical protein